MYKYLFTFACAVLITSCTSSVTSEPDVTPAPTKDTLTEIALHTSSNETVTVMAEIADTNELRAQGLMNRTNIPQNQGMLFVFTDEKPRAFWMKNTLVPLDILYFSADKQLVDWLTMDPCTEDPCVTYPSDAPAAYALEIPAGFLQRHAVSTDWYFTGY